MITKGIGKPLLEYVVTNNASNLMEYMYKILNMMLLSATYTYILNYLHIFIICFPAPFPAPCAKIIKIIFKLKFS